MPSCSKPLPVRADKVPLQDVIAIAIASLVPVYALAEAPHASSALLIAPDDAESAAERLVARYVRS